MRGYPTQDGACAAELRLKAPPRIELLPRRRGLRRARARDRPRHRRALRRSRRRDGQAGRADGRVHEHAQAVRRRDRHLPGAAPPHRRRQDAARTGPLDELLREPKLGEAPARAPARAVAGQGAARLIDALRRPAVHPAARRHRRDRRIHRQPLLQAPDGDGDELRRHAAPPRRGVGAGCRTPPACLPDGAPTLNAALPPEGGAAGLGAARRPADRSDCPAGLTDVAGIAVGHFTDTRRPTGCTVVLAAGRGRPASTCAAPRRARARPNCSPGERVEQVHAIAARRRQRLRPRRRGRRDALARRARHRRSVAIRAAAPASRADRAGGDPVRPLGRRRAHPPRRRGRLCGLRGGDARRAGRGQRRRRRRARRSASCSASSGR